MLSLVEKTLFLLAALISMVFSFQAAVRIIKTLSRGHGKPDWSQIPRRLPGVLAKTISLQPTFRLRLIPSLIHAFIAWGFIFYLFVNLGDVLAAFIPGFVFLGTGFIASVYRLGSDLLSAAVLTGMAALLVRRFVLHTPALAARQDVLLHPKTRSGIRRDSIIVGLFILVHVGARLWGASLRLADGVSPDPWQPVASTLAYIWRGWSEQSLHLGEHLSFWLAIGTILGFMPYFLVSKHLHLFFAPLNFLLKPQRRSIGELSKLDFEDESVEQYGATHLEDLGWEQLMDAYACIMCYRCQEVCPAYNTGKVLSPATLEINKRYFLNSEGAQLAAGLASTQTLLEFAISEEAVWACTACGACVDICPVGNEPMRDILDIRRALVLTDNIFPAQLQAAFRGMERNTNPWNISPADRLKWADGLEVQTIETNPQPDVLWWVGCAPATDPRAQKTARAFAQLLQAAGINFAVLGKVEQCTGDSARRAGNEYLFNELAQGNVEILNEVKPKRIVTTCPHCLHTLKNEYPAFGGNYRVSHHSQFLEELLDSGKLHLKKEKSFEDTTISFHDPCYLGRQNGVIEPPRKVLQASGLPLVEMPRHKAKSFCCGAGGAQMWKEEEPGSQRVSANRMQEAIATGAKTLAVGCPFCNLMLNDAARGIPGSPQVLDLAEIILEQLDRTKL